MNQLPLLHVCLDRGSFTMTRYCASYWRDLKERTQVIRIEEMFRRDEWPRGIYFMTGADGMSTAQLNAVERLWKYLSSKPEAFAVLNRPSRLLGRYRLLRKMHELGMNDFNVYRVADRTVGIKFPVFVRYEHLHRANLTSIIKTQDELDDEIAKLLLSGEREDELLVVEFLDYRDDDGIYRKYGAQKIGRHVFGKHLMSGPHWMLKRKTTDPKAVGNEEMPYVQEFPHHAELEPVFELSGHDWARIDYSFYKGRVQVWEINDNPEMGTKWKRDFGRRKIGQTIFTNFRLAFDEVASRIEPGSPLRFELSAKDVLTNANDNCSNVITVGENQILTSEAVR